MAKILIVANRKDDHALAVSECLMRKGEEPILWFPDEFLLNQKSIQKITSHGHHSLIINQIESLSSIDLLNIEVVWYRRSKMPTIPDGIDPVDQGIIEAENRMHMRSIWQVLAKQATWINPLSTFDKANSKAVQLKEAAKVGLLIPKTLITNDKKAIIDFFNENKTSGVIYKTFLPVIWEENNYINSCYASEITESILPAEDVLSLTPGIYQEKINKQFEVRVTFFGDEYVAVKIHNSKETDWRYVSATSGLDISPFNLPNEIYEKCLSLMSELGIVFGCCDFIVTPDNKFIFLEVNEMGQFLWKEEKLPELFLLDKFSEFLMSFTAAKTSLNSPRKFTLKEYIEFCS